MSNHCSTHRSYQSGCSRCRAASAARIQQSALTGVSDFAAQQASQQATFAVIADQAAQQQCGQPAAFDPGPAPAADTSGFCG